MPRAFSVWGERAELALRVRLLLYAKYLVDMEAEDAIAYQADIKLAALAALKPSASVPEEACDILQDWGDGVLPEDQVPQFIKNALADQDVEEETHRWYFTTPIRNRLHIVILALEGKLLQHPWGKFLFWYSHKYNQWGENVFNERQRVVADTYEVYLSVLNWGGTINHQVVLCVKGGEKQYVELFDDNQEMAYSELRRLKGMVRYLEHRGSKMKI